ncbi:ATP-binding protein [Xanthomonas sp. SHU 308]|uniref:AAA family ATPase n=1 Tax=Xanthomonas sp. SHU 308 TaxID=1591201 RepID=UPI0009DAE147|nr:ATP-binding protein [Xanthomonas sp. SHU 308]
MLTKISCNGFRSLSNFSMDIKPGINLLLGPNGSGKTNIISLLDFIGKLAELPLTEAVSALGGAGAIFRKIGDTGYEDRVQISIYGYSKASARLYFKFKFEVEIELSADRDSVIYSKQELVVERCTKAKLKEPNIIPEIDVSAMLGADGKVKISCEINEKFEVSIPKSEINKVLASLHDADHSLLQLTPRIISPLWIILFDIAGGLSLNVIPSKAKQAEDSTAPARIQPDGSGLYSTLRAAFKSEQSPQTRRLGIRFSRYRYFESDFPKNSFSKILDATKFANSSINDIRIQNDPFDNKLKGSVVMADETKSELPISAMSDGTVKWLVLATAIYTKSKLISIEEPENYLHPLVQMEIIRIFREECGPDNFVFISTHSETLLNSAKPDEVVVVEFRSGRTTATRVTNSKQLLREIKKTGFGLGFYYVSGALEGSSDEIS